MQLTKVLTIATVACVASTCSALSPECRELWNLPDGEVCASNGRTYNNYCEVEYDSAKKNDSSLVVVHTGRCSTNTTNGQNQTNSSSHDEITIASVRSDAAENGPAALWAVATSALAAITFAALI